MKSYEQLKQERIRQNNKLMCSLTKEEYALVVGCLAAKSHLYPDEKKADTDYFSRILFIDGRNVLRCEIELHQLTLTNKQLN